MGNYANGSMKKNAGKNNDMNEAVRKRASKTITGKIKDCVYWGKT